MKKELKVVAIVLVALIVFLSGFGLGATKGINISGTITVEGGATPAAATQPAATQPAATQPAATEPAATEKPADPQPAATEKPADPQPAATEKPADPAPAAPSAAGVPSSTAEIVAKYNEVVNAVKHGQGFHVEKTSNTNIEVTDAPALKSQINSIVQGLVKPSSDSFDVNDPDGANGAITPGNRDIALDPAGVKSATATPTADGGYTMTIVIIEEVSSFDGTNTVKPVHHTSCLSPLNLAELDISPAKISTAEMKYPGATLNCTVDSQGRLTHYDFKLPMSGSGTGKLGISISVGLEGEMVETYDFTYNS